MGLHLQLQNKKRNLKSFQVANHFRFQHLKILNLYLFFQYVFLLLLDEIAAHLDAARRTALFEAIGELGAQAWMTGTDESLFAPLASRAQFYTVTKGRIFHEASHG